MTCIVGLVHDGKVWMGGDRASVGDSHYLSISGQPKVFQRGYFLFGYTSSFRMGQLLQYKLSLPSFSTEVPLDEFMTTTFIDQVRQCFRDNGWLKVKEGREESGVFLVGIKGNLYTVDDDFNVRRQECNYDAIGCGVSVALGSLFTSAKFKVPPSDRLLMALDASSHFVTGVRPPFDVIVEDA